MGKELVREESEIRNDILCLCRMNATVLDF